MSALRAAALLLTLAVPARAGDTTPRRYITVDYSPDGVKVQHHDLTATASELTLKARKGSVTLTPDHDRHVVVGTFNSTNGPVRLVSAPRLLFIRTENGDLEFTEARSH
jgi:hypothetical protein